MRHITSCLSSRRGLNQRLANICRHAMELETLNTVVKKFLPPHLRERCNVGSFLKNNLTLTVDSAVWSTELHYHLGEIRDKLRSQGGLPQLSSIKIAVNNAPHFF